MESAKCRRKERIKVLQYGTSVFLVEFARSPFSTLPRYVLKFCKFCQHEANAFPICKAGAIHFEKHTLMCHHRAKSENVDLRLINEPRQVPCMNMPQ